MKKSSNFFSKGAVCALLLGGMTFASCGSEGFSASDAENALEDFAPLFNENSEICTRTLNTGYYEVTPEGGNSLRQMVKAGVITCKFDVVKEEITRYRYVGWDREEYTEYKHHIFANVQLTKEGEKYLKQSDLKNEVRDDYKKVVGKIQESMSKDLETPEYATIPDTIFYREESEAATEPNEKIYGNSGNEAKDNSAKKSAYEIALAKVAPVPVAVRTHKVELKDVFDVYATEDMLKNNKGECKFTIQMTDLTPFAWMDNKDIKNEMIVLKADFKKYQDKGWVVEDLSDGNMKKIFGVEITPLPKEEK